MEKNEKKPEICNYKMSNGEFCGRPLHDDEHCIFHSKDIEGKKKGFNYEFWKEFEEQKENETIYDFTGFIFPQLIQFYEMEFEKDVQFWKAIFCGGADFGRTKFHKKINFRQAVFKWANFENAQSKGEICFENSTFNDGVTFRDARFNGDTSFSMVHFYGKADFSNAQFCEKAYFFKAHFYENVDFNGAKFSSMVDFEKIALEKVDNFKMLDVFLYNVSGLFEFFEENNKKFKYSYRTEFLPDNFKLILGEEARARYPVFSRKIRDDMYLLDKKERLSAMRGMKKYKDRTLYCLWWLTSDYGRSFKRWAAWCIGIAFVFSWLFYVCYSTNSSSFQAVYINEWCPWFSFFYYSVVTFTTLGFGDIVPKCGWLQLAVMLEVIAGYIMLGGLISILANKLARRS